MRPGLPSNALRGLNLLGNEDNVQRIPNVYPLPHPPLHMFWAAPLSLSVLISMLRAGVHFLGFPGLYRRFRPRFADRAFIRRPQILD